MIEGSEPLGGDAEPDQPLIEELRKLADDARIYAEAEVAFQKTRAALVAKAVRKVAVLGLAAFVIAVFALGALVVGLLIALAPVVTAWGATAIVAGGLFLVAIVCVLIARSHWQRMMQAFSPTDLEP